MKHTIRLSLLLIALLFCALFAGCKEETPIEYAIDPVKLAADLTAGLTFDDQLVNLTDEAVAAKYAYGQQTASAWAGSGATAELVLIAEFADEAAAKTGLDRCGSWLNGQADLYAKYAANEVPKLQNALKTTLGRWMIVVVSGDTSAAEALLEQLTAPEA